MDLRRNVKYRIKSKPRKVKKVGTGFIIVGAILFITGDWILTPIFRAIPLDLWILIFDSAILIGLTQVWLAGLVLVYLGIWLQSFNWHKGTARISLADESIYLSGKVPTFFDFQDLSEINVFSNSIFSKNSIRFDGIYDRITIKFSDGYELISFIRHIKPIVDNHKQIRLNNWEF